MSLDETTTTSSVPSPGARLRLAREATGMSQDDVAAKLKLSVRQIAAIETGDWSALPERTFTRGFMRSYARLVGLDPETVGIEQGTSQSIAATELKPTPEGIGEIAHEPGHGGGRAARWAVPAVLIAVLAAGAAYFQWGHLFTSTGKSPATVGKATASAVAQPEITRAEATPAAVIAPPPLPTGGAPGKDEPAAAASGAVSAAVPAASPPAPVAMPAAAASPALLPGPGEKRITLTFKGKSWTEVRSKGEVIFSETADPGTREFNGAVPLSFTVGNASNVVITVDGKPFDLSEITRNDVARFRIE